MDLGIFPCIYLLLENSVCGGCNFFVSGDTFSAMCIPVSFSSNELAMFEATLDPIHLASIKKNILIANCVVSVVEGSARVWTITSSVEFTVV